MEALRFKVGDTIRVSRFAGDGGPMFAEKAIALRGKLVQVVAIDPYSDDGLLPYLVVHGDDWAWIREQDAEPVEAKAEGSDAIEPPKPIDLGPNHGACGKCGRPVYGAVEIGPATSEPYHPGCAALWTHSHGIEASAARPKPVDLSETATSVDDASILTQAADIIYGDREQTYGKPADNLDRIARLWQAILGCDVTAEKVCICMAALKLARLVNRPDHRDSQVDVCGYMALMERIQA